MEKYKYKIIKGKRLYYKFITENDTENIIKWRNNVRVKENFIYQKEFTKETHLNWLHKRVEKGEVVQFIIYEIDSNRAIGSVYLRDIDNIHRKAEFGIFIGEDDKIGNGYGSEAIKFTIEFAFMELKLHKVISRAFSNNKASIRIHEKAGFEREAYLKDDVCINGIYRDIILMGIINKDKQEK